MLTKSQANAFYNVIREVKLDPLDFLLDNKEPLIITHKPSGFSFKVPPFNSSGKILLNNHSTPDDSQVVVIPNKYKHLGGTTTWADTHKHFFNWLRYIEEEDSALDLWAEAAKTAQLFAPSATPSDDKFTRAELAEVQGQLRQLQQSFTTAALPEAARQKLIELTQTAAVKAEGLTKKDWQNWIIGGFISAITALSLNPTQAADVLKLVKAAFGGLFLH